MFCSDYEKVWSLLQQAQHFYFEGEKESVTWLLSHCMWIMYPKTDELCQWLVIVRVFWCLNALQLLHLLPSFFSNITVSWTTTLWGSLFYGFPFQLVRLSCTGSCSVGQLYPKGAAAEGSTCNKYWQSSGVLAATVYQYLSTGKSLSVGPLSKNQILKSIPC